MGGHNVPAPSRPLQNTVKNQKKFDFFHVESVGTFYTPLTQATLKSPALLGLKTTIGYALLNFCMVELNPVMISSN